MQYKNFRVKSYTHLAICVLPNKIQRERTKDPIKIRQGLLSIHAASDPQGAESVACTCGPDPSISNPPPQPTPTPPDASPNLPPPAASDPEPLVA